jgi:uncharacterized protein YjbJ (UPF0337 family)
MGDRMDELKGNIKEGVGKLSGDEDLRAEGAAESDTAEARRETRGAMQEVGGKVKEGFGKLTGDEATEAEGKADQLRGKANRAG